MTVPRKTLPDCPVERCIAVLSGRWKAMLLWRLFLGPQRYSALAAMVPGVSQRALSQALAELAADGVITRRDDAWALTPVGQAMQPTLATMAAWGALHQSAADGEAAAPSPRLRLVGG